MTENKLNLKATSFQALFTSEGLRELDEAFLKVLKVADQSLFDQLMQYRSGGLSEPKAVSDFIIRSGAVLETFIAELFSIQADVERLQAATLSHDPVFAFKKYYVLREARRALKTKSDDLDFNELNQWIKDQFKSDESYKKDPELAIARWGQGLLVDPESNQASIDRLIEWCVAAIATPEGQAAVVGWPSFRFPKRLDYNHLVDTSLAEGDALERLEGPPSLHRERDGFTLTDERMSARDALNEIHYCVYCHKTDGDFCSKGFPNKKSEPDQGLKVNPLGDALKGCPLEEKISEMHMLKKSGYGIAALAVVMIDNPMCPATGHRICNDCMKACIYQKREPVNIPEVETRVLTDVLYLPWGVEVYDLLTRWNPLRSAQWVAQPYNGKKALVMGMGPAGFTLAHHLLMEGFAVVGADGLKIEPLNKSLMDKPIEKYTDLIESLDDRIMAGFGGVAEYGITVRWDKNFLKLIYMTLMRRPRFQVFGSVRFGGTLTVEDAWALGFDHLAIAVGAGLPRELVLPNSLAPGMRQANDFLMALQLTGAAKASSLANLQVRLPAVVIGGGLTGIDTATEVQAYYIKQVEKIAYRYQLLTDHFGCNEVRKSFEPNDLKILDEFLLHGKRVQAERELAAAENRAPQFLALIREWGGVTIAYRRHMQESPAYRSNHEEVIKALEEGIYYAEALEPSAVQLDEAGHVSALACTRRLLNDVGRWVSTDDEVKLPARSIFVATGAQPNIAYEYEHRGTFLRDDRSRNYKHFTQQGGRLMEQTHQGTVKMDDFGAFTSYDRDDHRVSFLGDTHPVFQGSVVKAVASAKRVYPEIVKAVVGGVTPAGDAAEYSAFKQKIKGLFSSKIESIKRHHSSVIEVKVRAPIAAKNFKPGQFYRLQNYETHAAMKGLTRLQTEAMAMIGARSTDDPDVLSFMVSEHGVSSRLVATFAVGQPVALMGPTGVAASIPTEPETIMILGGPMAAAHLRSMGPAMRQAGHRVLYVACMKTRDDLYDQTALEAACDGVLWVTASGPQVKPTRKEDRSASGEWATVLRDYAESDDVLMPLDQVNRVIVVGAASFLRCVQQGRSGVLKGYFSEKARFVGSVYGPMQCMLKGVCAQCLQWQIDPKTGQRTKAVYACSWQDQPMEKIDIDNIDERLVQNRTQEVLSNLWLDYLFETETVERF